MARRRQKPVGHLKRDRRKRKGKKVTVRYADGTTAVVKPGHFQKKKPAKQKPTKTERQRAYRDYLATPHWQEVRSAALKRDDHRCVACGDDCHLEVHHYTYERLGKELLADVVTLCRWCHIGHHKGDKRITKRKEVELRGF